MMPDVNSWSEINNKEFDLERTYKKSELANQQLTTAIWLFLNRIDFSSAITLAGASGNIFHALVEYENKQPTLENTRLICSKLMGHTPGRVSYLNHFANLTGINRLKHMSEKCPDIIKIDLEKSAEIALTRVALDFISLYGETEARKNPAVNSFMQWLWATQGEKLMKEYEELPKELKGHGVRKS